MNKNYNRILVEDTQGNRSYKGVYNPAREDVGITKKKPELTPKQKALLKNKTELTLYSEELGGYIHMYYVSNELLFNKVNIERANISRLIYLATYIDYNDRQENLLIKYSQCKEIEPMTRKDIKEKLGLSDRAFINFLNDVKNNNLIYEVNKKFYINPDYLSKGKINKGTENYTRIFIKTTRLLYENCSIRQHKQLSYIFQLIPYINKELNVICNNPNETDFTKIKKLNLKQICEILKVSTNKDVMRKFRNDLIKFNINIDGKKYFFLSYAKVLNGYGLKDYFAINPKIVWSGNRINNANETIQVCFFD